MRFPHGKLCEPDPGNGSGSSRSPSRAASGLAVPMETHDRRPGADDRRPECVRCVQQREGAGACSPTTPGADADRRLEMAWADVVLECLKANKVQTLVHIPDTVLTDLIRQANEDDFFDVLNPTREEEGVAILCGAYLGGRNGAL